MRRTLGISVLCAFVLVWVTPVAAQPADEDPVATGKVAGTILTVSPKISFASATLRVAGPAGFEAIAWSEGGPLSLDLLTNGWIAGAHGVRGTPATLPDGRYGYELTLHLGDGGRRTHSEDFLVANGTLRRLPASEGGPGPEDAEEVGETNGDVGLRVITAASDTTSESYFITDNDADGQTSLVLNSALASAGEGNQWWVSNVSGDFRVSDTAPLINQFTVKPSGRVGIGTTQPQADLHIYSPGGTIRLTDNDPCDWNPPGSSWEIEEDSTRLMFEVVPQCNGDPVGGKVWFTQQGRVGIGTPTPGSNLDISTNFDPELRFEQTGTHTIPPQTWRIRASELGFQVVDSAPGVVPFQIEAGAPGYSLLVATGGNVGVGIWNPAAKLHVMGNGIIEGDVSLGSSRTIKHEIEPLDGAEVLSALRDLPIYTWKYRDDPVQAPHAGPMAEDVYAAFRLGRDDKHLSPADSAGLALAAIRGVDERLERELETLRDRNAELASANEELGEQLARMEERLSRLEEGEE